MSKPLISYSQNREDLILHVLLSSVDKGFYVDVGANHPEQDSVTKFFYVKGWHGINIEPIPELYKSLKKARPRDLNLNIGLSNKPGNLKLRQYSNGLNGWSTFSEKIKDYRGDIAHTDYDVSVQTLEMVFEKHKVKEVDFLKVDVEGFEFEVLSGNNWSVYRPKVVVIENTPGEWAGFLKGKGYAIEFFDGLNYYYVRNDLLEEYNMNNYAMLFEKGTIAAKDYIEIDQYKRECARISSEYSTLTDQIAAIHNSPENFLGGRILLKSLLRKIRSKVVERLK